jgi:ribosomal protein S9
MSQLRFDLGGTTIEARIRRGGGGRSGFSFAVTPGIARKLVRLMDRHLLRREEAKMLVGDRSL